MAQSEGREVYGDEYSRLRAHGAVNETEMGGYELVSRREGERKGEGGGSKKRQRERVYVRERVYELVSSGAVWRSMCQLVSPCPGAGCRV